MKKILMVSVLSLSLATYYATLGGSSAHAALSMESLKAAKVAKEKKEDIKIQGSASESSLLAKSSAPKTSLPVTPEAKHIIAANLATEYLTRLHYRPQALDDAMSANIFDRYIKNLDSEKLLFLEKDIEQFKQYRLILDDAIFQKNLNPMFDMYNTRTQRIKQRYEYALSLLKGDFDFTAKEVFYYDREKAAWPKTEEELNEIWRLRIKNDWLRLKLAGKEKNEIVATLTKRYESNLNYLSKIKSDDAFQAFMQAYSNSYEPHTNFFIPRVAEDFDTGNRLSIIGIGATLTERDDMTTIREITPGGPVALSGKFKVGDRIIGVAQGVDGKMIDVVGWRLDDVIKLIRGPKDSVVMLNILPAGASPDGETKKISLVRKKITFEQLAAKKLIIEVPSEQEGVKRKIGVIDLPSFYQDYEGRIKKEKDYKSATRDVSRIIKELKAEKVEAIIVDLRNNGGGSLNEAINLTSLFVGSTPILQEKLRNKKPIVHISAEQEVEWEGPLGVMINNNSASASEIFAAAIQDYGRGIVMGHNSYGKGTVQKDFSFDQLLKTSPAQYGDINLTTAQFFRVNGGTTQLKGVTPDIAMPRYTEGDNDKHGEAEYDNPLPWVQIAPATYTPFANLQNLVTELDAKHKARIKNDQEFQFIFEDIEEYKRVKAKKFISLNEEERRQERLEREKKMKEREVLRDKLEKRTDEEKKVAKLAQDDGLNRDERSLQEDIAKENALKKAKDVYLNEAAKIMSDQIQLIKTQKPYANLNQFTFLKKTRTNKEN